MSTALADGEKVWEPPEHWDLPSPVLAGWVVYLLRLWASMQEREESRRVIGNVASQIDQTPMASYDLAANASDFLRQLGVEYRATGKQLEGERIIALAELVVIRALKRGIAKDKPREAYAGHRDPP